MSAEKKQELTARLQSFGSTLEESIPKYLEYDIIAASNKKKLDRFFDSNWYRLLTDVDATILVGEAKRQVEDRYEKQQRAIQRSRARRAAFAM